MPTISSQINCQDEQFRKNYEHNLALLDEVRNLEQRIRDNSAKSRDKFIKRDQLLPRERLSLLLDRGSPFVELSTLCGYLMDDDDGAENIMGGNLIGGIGYVSGVRAMLIVSDSGIKGGFGTAMGSRKARRLQQIAIDNLLPCIYLVESAGANLLRQADMFVDSGEYFANMARMSALGIPSFTIVHGSSTAGGAYVPGLSDYVIMVRNRAKVFLAGPPLVKAAIGEDSQDEELGGAAMHHQISGTAEYIAESDTHAIGMLRDLLRRVSAQNYSQNKPFLEPRYPIDELLGVLPDDYKRPFDIREVLARIIDDSDFLEFKGSFGAHTVVGHAKVCGQAVGIITNNGPIDPDGANKAGQFIQLCCQSGTPLIFLQNTTGFMVGRQVEERGIVKHGSKLIQAVANASVPKLTLHIGPSFGAGNYAMCGRGLNPQFIFSWPNNRIAVMGGEQAAKVMEIVTYQGSKRKGITPDEEKLSALTQKIIETYDKESTALFATARLWDDGIIDPRDTRKVLGLCLDICMQSERQTARATSFGVARL